MTKDQIALTIRERFRFVTFEDAEGNVGWRLKEGNVEEVADAILALSPPEPTEDAVLDLIRSCWGDQKMRDALTVTKWKDGIDIQLPSHSLMQFVAAIRAMPLQDGAVVAERERCARIVDAEVIFARENLDAIPDEAEGDLGSRLTPRYYWGQRLALAKHYASEIRSPAVASIQISPRYHWIEAARAVCRVVTKDCVMDTNPERPPCDDHNCSIVPIVRAAIKKARGELTQDKRGSET